MIRVPARKCRCIIFRKFSSNLFTNNSTKPPSSLSAFFELPRISMLLRHSFSAVLSFKDNSLIDLPS
ncbi:hypothetical protein HZS_1612 [Henneguya salminicola]|nr:hypothetical protein HZS_1612 [Henneguya salminicola]